MKQGSTLFLKGVVLFLGAIVLALCIFALPAMWKEGSEEFPEASRAVFLIIISMYLTAAPFFFALWQALRLLRYIDKNIAFSDQCNFEMSPEFLKALTELDVPVSFTCYPA